jgi:hypothetical protein
MTVSDYWATAAQVMAVLALAIVVEARAIVGTWVPGQDRILKAILGIAWTFPMAVFSVGIPACLRALSGATVWDGWPGVINSAISSAAYVVIGSPAVDFLFRSNAWLISRALAWMVGRRIVRSSERHSRSYRQRLREGSLTLLRFEHKLAGQAARVDAHEDQLLHGEHPDCDECQAKLEQVSVLRSLIAESEAEIADLRQSILDEDQVAEEEPDKIRERLRILTQKLEVAFETGVPPSAERVQLPADSKVSS